MQHSKYKQIKKEVSRIADDMQNFSKKKNLVDFKEKYLKLVGQIEKLGLESEQCYNLIIKNDKEDIKVMKKDPESLLNFYSQIINAITNYFLKVSKQDKYSSILKEISNINLNSCTIFETIAKKTLQNYQQEQQISQLNMKLQLTNKKLQIQNEINTKIDRQTSKLLENYRLNFIQIINVLKKAQNNDIQLNQSNRILNQELQSLQIQFQTYKKDFKLRPNMQERQAKIRRNLQNQYKNALQSTTKKLEFQFKIKQKNKSIR